MKIIKLFLSIAGILLLLIALQFYRQSSEPHSFIWEVPEIEQVFTALGAKEIAVSEKNVVTFTLEQGSALFDGVQGNVSLYPSAPLEQTVEIPQGQDALEPKVFRNDDGLFQFVFSDGQQQLFRTAAQERMFSMKNATRQIALQVINGVTLGGVYALVAVGYTLVYGIMMMINFAHGEIFMFGAYGAFFAFSAFAASGELKLPWLLAFLASLLIAMAVSAGVGLSTERAAYRPLRNAPRLTLLISAIGASIFLQNVMMLITSGRIKYYPNNALVKGAIPLFGGVAIEKIGILIIALSIAMMSGLYLIIQKTKIGKAIRAVAEDRNTASLMGINVNQIIVTTFLLGSSMAGAGGIMVGLRDTQINHMMGFLPGMKAFTAAVLGGIGNIPGAMLGGYFLGVAEALGAQFMPAEYKDVIAFTLLVFILIFRPTGLMGEVLATKKM
ncbi:high-affinity branched-chain amino acid ABC transporter [Candidatus Moduliflexus flocculans]|uniref:High-affinity branched-chain amino acid ABC transporter n=1 Tax=Candidatus Moduliflexus flocculans TaxID=1499966 RepID=A0A0S6VTA4_9BACT|nr:high-affinity branched-chain amino acid ABC transporter [Candidatus Moduliflexus flocculans]